MACFTKDFDERFYLGSGLYLSCEEVDFLLSNFDKGKKIVYEPIVTVYHRVNHVLRRFLGLYERCFVYKTCEFAYLTRCADKGLTCEA